MLSTPTFRAHIGALRSVAFALKLPLHIEEREFFS